MATPDEVAGATGDAPTAASVPYMSFQGFRGLLDRLGQDGLPQVFDRSFFGDRSGSLVAQTRGALRFLGLVDDEWLPTPLLRQIADSDEPIRVRVLAEVARSKYADVLALGTNATQGQLEQVFKATGLSGESITKAINFYMGLADYVGLPVSPYFKKPAVRASVGGNGTRRTTRRKRQAANPPPPPPADEPAPAVVPSEQQQKAAYVDMLMKLTVQSADKGDVQTDLLDRLERALGYGGSPSGD